MSAPHLNRFQLALQHENAGRPPVWLMRQAGRYHSHYQRLRARYSFIELCKKPEVACEATMGPIRDFDFDAAILFSDLLFPLEAMGMGLSYEPGPKLAWHLKETADLERLQGGATLASHLSFQGEALRLIRRELDPSKGLLGFVGGPLTLFYYAVQGSHQGELSSARRGLEDGRYIGFIERLLPLLAENMALQARAGADTVAVLDTCAGELSPDEYRMLAMPALARLFAEFHALCPETPISYYSKGTGPEHWRALQKLPVACMGVDWNHPLTEVLPEFGRTHGVQGNIDPSWLFLPSSELEEKLRGVFTAVRALPENCRRGWVCGLGHGVLPKTPEESVRLFIRLQREVFHD